MQSYHYQERSYEIIASTYGSIFNFDVKYKFFIANTTTSSKIGPNDRNSWLAIFWIVTDFVEKIFRGLSQEIRQEINDSTVD